MPESGQITDGRHKEMYDIKGYTLIENTDIDDIKGRGLIYEHNKTGAKVVVLDCEDTQPSFAIAFRTPPEENRGTPHIIEHSVFCGSRKYPLKDPFVELMKGSMYTFLNAITYGDMTVFPVATTNAKDFEHLTDVYLDAVFNPLFLENEAVFMQEGWHFETADNTDRKVGEFSGIYNGETKLNVSGVVFNEMRGMEDSPDYILNNKLKEILYPDTPYRYVSGGVPEEIIELTYEEMCRYYKSHYHPSNSIMILYGKFDIPRKLSYISAEYLDKYEKITMNNIMPLQKSFDAPAKAECFYQASDEENAVKGTYYAYAAVVADTHSAELSITLQILNYVLCLAPGACLREAFMEAGVGEDLDVVMDDQMRQAFYGFECSGCRDGEKESFVNIIEDTLKKAVKEGLDKEMLFAAVKNIDFNYREADFDGSPKGLAYSDMLLERMLFDEEEPFARLKVREAVERVREYIGTDYFERFIQEKILDNPHKAIIEMKPDLDMCSGISERLANKIRNRYAGENPAELERRCAIFEKYKQADDDEKHKEMIPVLAKEDLQTDRPYTATINLTVNGRAFMFQPRKTNGIGYLNLAFDIRKLPEERLPYVRLLVELLGVLDTEEYSYSKLTKLIDIHTGGIYNYISIADGTVSNGKVTPLMLQRTGFFYNEIDKVCALNYEILCRTDFSDRKYIKELLLQLKSTYTGSYSASAGETAADIGRSGFSETALLYEKIQGYDFYRFLCNLTENYEEYEHDISEKLADTLRKLTAIDNCRIIYAGEEKSLEDVRKHVEKLIEDIRNAQKDRGASILPKTCNAALREGESAADAGAAGNRNNDGLLHLTPVRKGSMAYIAPTQVQYVAMCGDAGEKVRNVRGHMLVLEHILNCDYLWRQVRVNGGAYGCSADFSYNGGMSFVSYRDPNIRQTVEVFLGAARYIRNIDISPRELQQYIVGTMNKLDVPMTPESEAMSQIQLDLSGISNEEMLRIREQIINTTVQDIRALADIIEETAAESDVIVVGSEEAITAEKSFFKSVYNFIR